MEYAQVVIVGGGVAGLAAAKTFGSKVNYVLVEAQNYLGGRILTVDPVPNLTVDLGAQYVHGDKKNTVYDICNELGILLSTDDDDDAETMVVTSDGRRVDSSLIDKGAELWERVIDKAKEKYEDRPPSAAVSFASFVPKEFQRRLVSSASFSGDLIEPIIEYFSKLEMLETSCSSLSEVNLKEYVAYEDLPGESENQLKNGGYRPFVNYLKSFVANPDRIRLNCEVTDVKFDQQDGKVLVETKDLNGQRTKTIVCDHIIWTTSLGYLKKNFHRIFAEEPELLQQKQNAIANIGFGTVNKVILVYKTKFWNSKTSDIEVLHTLEHPSFDMSAQLREQLETEGVAPGTLDEIVRMLFTYDVLPSTDIPVLVCWFVGPAAVTIERLSSQLVGQICHEALSHYLKIAHDQHPPVHTLRTAWHSNPYICGSYSFHSMHSTKRDSEQLRASYAPDGTERILFAGEATHEGYYSTVNAALETGIQAGEKVLSLIGGDH